MKDTLRDLIATGQTEQAIKELLKLTKSLNDSHLHGEVIMQSARYESYAKKQRSGTGYENEQNVTIAKINEALLYIIDRLPEKPLAPQPQPPVNKDNPPEKQKTAPEQPARDTPTASKSGPTSKSVWLGIIALAAAIGLFAVMVVYQDSLGNAGPLGEMLFLLLLGILAGVAFFEFMPSSAESDGKVMGMNVKLRGPIIAGIAVAVGGYFFLQNAAEGPFNFTVSLQQDASLQIPATYPAMENATLQLRLGNEWKPAPVDANGDADFKNIADDYREKEVVARLDARYWGLQSDSLQLSGKSRTLQVIPDGSLSTITGKVKDATTGDPLPGATVEVLGITGESDNLGNFELKIPLDKQRDAYEVNAYLEGFKTFKGNATPATGAPMSILLEKK